MAYNKKTWQTGDLIDAAGMNNIENGIKTLSNKVPDYTSNSGKRVLQASTLAIPDVGTEIYYEWVKYNFPDLPSNSSDGTYVLKATKSGSTITYSWVQET